MIELDYERAQLELDAGRRPLSDWAAWSSTVDRCHSLTVNGCVRGLITDLWDGERRISIANWTLIGLDQLREIEVVQIAVEIGLLECLEAALCELRRKIEAQ